MERLIRFDWAIKHVLRNKANFGSTGIQGVDIINHRLKPVSVTGNRLKPVWYTRRRIYPMLSTHRDPVEPQF